jgi:hypothetical protein
VGKLIELRCDTRHKLRRDTRATVTRLVGEQMSAPATVQRELRRDEEAIPSAGYCVAENDDASPTLRCQKRMQLGAQVPRGSPRSFAAEGRLAPCHKQIGQLHQCELAVSLLSVQSRGHGCAMSGGRLPIIDPSLADRIGSFHQIMAGNVSLLYHKHDPGVEVPLRVIDIR